MRLVIRPPEVQQQSREVVEEAARIADDAPDAVPVRRGIHWEQRSNRSLQPVAAVPFPLSVRDESGERSLSGDRVRARCIYDFAELAAHRIDVFVVREGVARGVLHPAEVSALMLSRRVVYVFERAKDERSHLIQHRSQSVGSCAK